MSSMMGISEYWIENLLGVTLKEGSQGIFCQLAWTKCLGQMDVTS
jgi:hypothetical protein